MKRIIIHWTGGTYVKKKKEKEDYHFIVDGLGTVHKGNYTPEDNLNCYDGKYAKHTGGGNTGSIGIAMACMFGYKNPKNMGQYPMTNIQFEACMKKVAELCRQYNIAITPDTVLTHYEFGLKHPETSSAGKPDIGFLPPYPEVKYSDVGYFIRNKVRWYQSNNKNQA